jgi:hypothetical protein
MKIRKYTEGTVEQMFNLDNATCESSVFFSSDWAMPTYTDEEGNLLNIKNLSSENIDILENCYQPFVMRQPDEAFMSKYIWKVKVEEGYSSKSSYYSSLDKVNNFLSELGDLETVINTETYKRYKNVYGVDVLYTEDIYIEKIELDKN